MAGETFKPFQYGKEILKMFKIITPMDAGFIYIYKNNEGYYDYKLSEQILKGILNQKIPNPTKYKVNETIEWIRRKTYTNPSTIKSEEYVCLKNGLFNLNTLELEPHTPTKFVTYKIPVYYDSNIDTTEWNNFVVSIVESGSGDEKVLQEAVGNIFAPHYLTKKAIYLYGPNDSGKSTFLNIIMYLLGGRENVSNLSLVQLEEKFTNARIFGKRANICSDTPYLTNPRHYQTFKNFTGGDTVTLQHKHRDPFEYLNVAKFFFSANEIPKVKAKYMDTGFLRRWQFVECPHIFSPDDSIFTTYTTDKMLSAIFNWAVEGYKRLKEQNWIHTNDNTVEDVKRIFVHSGLEESDFIKWLMQRCEKYDGWTAKDELYYDCVQWFGNNHKVPPTTTTYFGRLIMEQDIIPIKDHHPMVDGQQTNAYYGIRLIDNTIGDEDYAI